MTTHNCPSNPCPICHPANDAHKLAALILADRTRATPANPVAGGLVERERHYAMALESTAGHGAWAFVARDAAASINRLCDALEALGGGVEADDAREAVLNVRAANAGDFKRERAVWEAYDRACLDCHAAIAALKESTP